MTYRRTGRPVGRPPGAISHKRKMAHEIVAKLEKELGRSVHPLEGLLRIGADESQPVELRVTCMKEALPYVLPRLQQRSVAITGADDGPVEVVPAGLTEAIMADPVAVQLAQR